MGGIVKPDGTEGIVFCFRLFAFYEKAVKPARALYVATRDNVEKRDHMVKTWQEMEWSMTEEARSL